MKDCIGQEIREGDKVIWSGYKYAGSNVYTVERLTPKRVKAYLSVGGSTYTIPPENCVVVTSNLDPISTKAYCVSFFDWADRWWEDRWWEDFISTEWAYDEWCRQGFPKTRGVE